VTVRVGINGFGRIGRNFFRAVVASGADIEIVAANDLTDNATIAHLLKYDSILGRLPADVTATDEGITVDNKLIRMFEKHDPVLTKDAIAGRIRRLLAMADKRAEELGIPDTEASLTPEMLADEG